ncbi:hypothetical protein [Undibacterium sp. TS12]|uniref:hypothetical protein n=1 Tax=Undibacterium sp. TS12 TaxID=2908202 RepID=UPI001F4C832D|nr:hypothetical protein [Undibacterium sp. TS12]MCH8617895.1 hypothetical protein [Undibacterium sp. TS12]
MLIALLALQFSWGPVAAYCLHETGKAAQHLGHHSDSDTQNDGASVLKEKSGDIKKASAHSHCSSCAHDTLSISCLDCISPLQVAEAAPVSAKVILSSYYVVPPERPKWTFAA